MMKRRKDSGFTLIELMIVIAVIGILAIVLVPRIGTIKTQSKEAGLDTNVRVVQGYVESKITKWVANDIDQADVVDEIVAALTFTGEPTKQLVNPMTSTPGDAIEVADATAAASASRQPVIVLTSHAVANPPALADSSTTLAGAEGSVIVTVTAADTDEVVSQINIYAYGNGGTLLTDKSVEITP